MQLIKTTLRHLNEACMTNQKDEVWKVEIKNILADIKPAFNCKHMKSLNHNENCTLYSIKGEHCFSFLYNPRVHIKHAFCSKYVLNQLLSRTYFTVRLSVNWKRLKTGCILPVKNIFIHKINCQFTTSTCQHFCVWLILHRAR